MVVQMENDLMFDDEPTIEQTKAFATGLYQSVQVVADYVKERWRLIEGVFPNSQTGHRDAENLRHQRDLLSFQQIVKFASGND